jgi:hypothetical protein
MSILVAALVAANASCRTTDPESGELPTAIRESIADDAVHAEKHRKLQREDCQLGHLAAF